MARILGDADLGPRLRALRRLHGLSQRELAKRTGLANSTISLIEQGRISPSVASLKQLLAGFPISLADFFSSEPPAQHPSPFYRESELSEIGTGGLSFRLVGANRHPARLQLLHERYPPGGDTGAQMLRHEGDEAGVVVRGCIELTVGVERRVLRAGDAYYFDSRSPHRFRNCSEAVCEIVSACTPRSF